MMGKGMPPVFMDCRRNMFTASVRVIPQFANNSSASCLVVGSIRIRKVEVFDGLGMFSMVYISCLMFFISDNP